MNPQIRFAVLVIVSCAVFIGILKLVTHARSQPIPPGRVLTVTVLVVGGGMVFGRFGAQSGLPWWIYYPLPALLTVFLPPLPFSMNRRETALYVLLALASAPAIHIAFSLLLGWREYMPFLYIPSLGELLQAT